MYKVVRGDDETIRAFEYFMRRAAPLMGFAKYVLQTGVQHTQLQGAPRFRSPVKNASSNARMRLFRVINIRNRSFLTKALFVAKLSMPIIFNFQIKF